MMETCRIADTNLPVRVRKGLAWGGIETVGELLGITPDAALQFKNIGVAGIVDILRFFGAPVDMRDSQYKADAHIGVIQLKTFREITCAIDRQLTAVPAAPHCDGCRFWLHLDPATTGVADGEGECRRRAPSPVSQFRDDMASPDASWPLTFKDDWCGEHEAKA